jgi:hypothetical protein
VVTRKTIVTDAQEVSGSLFFAERKVALQDTSRLTIFLFTLCFLLIWANPVYAYLDPGSGSMIWKSRLAGLAGAFVVLKLFWHRILARQVI